MLRSATTYCTRALSARQLQIFLLLLLLLALQAHDLNTCYRMNAIDRKPAPQAKPQSQRKHKQPTESLRGPPSVTDYTPPTLHRADDGMSEDVFGTNSDDLGQFRRLDDNMGFHSLLRSDDESEDNEVENYLQGSRCLYSIQES